MGLLAVSLLLHVPGLFLILFLCFFRVLLIANVCFVKRVQAELDECGSFGLDFGVFSSGLGDLDFFGDVDLFEVVERVSEYACNEEGLAEVDAE